jgi:hypothetical protein
MKTTMLALTILLALSVSCHAQGLQDENQALQNLNPTDDLKIPQEICDMNVVMLQTKTKFCEFAKRFAIVGRQTKRYVALPMIRLTPSGQLVEMVGIPGRTTSDGDIQSFLFKNRGGILVIGGMLNNIRYSDKGTFSGRFIPSGPDQEDMDSLVGQRMLIDRLGLK